MANTAEEQQSAPKVKFPVAAYILMVQRLIRSMADFFARAVLNLYLRNKLLFPEQQAVSLVHGKRMITTFFMPLGAMFVSGLFNRFVIMLIGTILYAVGHFVFFIGSIPFLRQKIFVYVFWTIHGVGLFITGGAFQALCGDQFKLPEQQNLLQKYYGIQYVLHNVSTFLAYYLGPLLKTHITCFGEQDCYSISLGLGAALFSMEAIVYLVSHKYFVKKKPTDRIMINFCGCIGYGLKQWVRERKTNPRPNWLDHAESKYGTQMIDDIKRYFQILIVLTTIPIFFGVYNQMSTKWSFQATRMNGRISGTSYTIIPDHFQLLNPFLVVVLMPLITKVLDPITDRWGFSRTLRRSVLGMSMIAFSFAMAGFLESCLKQTYPKALQMDESELRIFNGLDCSYIIQVTDIGFVEMYALGAFTKKSIPVRGQKSIQLSSTDDCAFFSEDIILKGGKAISVSVQQKKDGTVAVVCYEEVVEKSAIGFPVVSVLGLDASDSLMIVDSKKVHIKIQVKADNKPCSTEVVPETYTMILNGRKITSTFTMHLGGVYVASVVGNDSMSLYEIVEPNSVHILWICPQTIVLTIGEIYHETAVMMFLYGEAPISLKQVVFATYLFADGLGDGLVVILTQFGNLEQDHEFYLSAFVITLDIVVLFFIALRFKPLDPSTKII